MDPFSIIITIAKEIAGGLRGIASYKHERRENAALLFEKIEKNLEDFVKTWRSNVSENSLSETEIKDKLTKLNKMIETFANELPNAVGDIIGREKAELFKKTLTDAYNAKSALLSFKEDTDAEKLLTILMKAAGEFSSSADLLRAS